MTARGIDHLVLAVRDLDAAAATYEALGFRLTPRAQHPFGTANRIVQLQGCFLELLEVDRPELIGASGAKPSFAEFNRDYLDEREGLSMLVVESAEADATRAEMAAAGLEPREVFSFERDATLPDGSVARVGFSTVFVDYPGAREAGFFACAQWRPELFWKPDYQVHGNGARGIRIVTAEAPEPAPFAEFIGRFVGAPVARRGSGYVIDSPRGRIEVREGGRQPTFRRFVIETADLDAVRSHASAAGIPFRETPHGLEFGADVMYGVTLGFAAA